MMTAAQMPPRITSTNVVTAPRPTLLLGTVVPLGTRKGGPSASPPLGRPDVRKPAVPSAGKNLAAARPLRQGRLPLRPGATACIRTPTSGAPGRRIATAVPSLAERPLLQDGVDGRQTVVAGGRGGGAGGGAAGVFTSGPASAPPGRRQWPDRPPVFSHRAISPMTIDRSPDLHMS